MKKTILATVLTSLFAATTAHSAMMHDADGISVELYGEIEIQYLNKLNEDEDAVLEINDANFGVQAGYDVNDDVTAFGVVSFDAADVDSDENRNAVLDDAYVGFASEKYGTITAGQQVTVFDDAGIGSDFEFGLASFYEQDDAGKQVIKYTIDKDTVYGSVAYLIDNGESDDGESAIDGKIGVRFEGVDLTAFYGRSELDGGGDRSNLNLEARYTMGDVTIAGAYASLNTDDQSALAGDVDNFGLAATYQLGKASFATGWSLTDFDLNSRNGGDKLNTYFVNAAYAFSSNVTSYIEIGGVDGSAELDSELGYVAGMRVTF